MFNCPSRLKFAWDRSAVPVSCSPLVWSSVLCVCQLFHPMRACTGRSLSGDERFVRRDVFLEDSCDCPLFVELVQLAFVCGFLLCRVRVLPCCLEVRRGWVVESNFRGGCWGLRFLWLRLCFLGRAGAVSNTCLYVHMGS